MKVISGVLRGRNIKGYNIDGTRTTMDRDKESLFASISSYIRDSVVLDLFAGSGNLGIEAISNGCSKCYFVDNNRECIRVISENISNFGIEDKSEVIKNDYLKSLVYFKGKGIKFDLILVDPPYEYKVINEVMDRVSDYGLLNEGGVIVLEYKLDDLTNVRDCYELLKFKKYGDKYISIYKFSSVVYISAIFHVASIPSTTHLPLT